MNEEEFLQSIQAIIQAHQNNYAQNEDVCSLISKITCQCSNLPNLINFLENCPKDSYHFMVTFMLMRELLQNRGCLLDNESLNNLLNQFMNFINNNSQEIIRNQTTPICSDVAAYLYRFIFEQKKDPNFSFDPVFQLLSGPSSSLTMVCLSILSSTVEIIKKPMSHLASTEKSELIKIFQLFQIPLYFQAVNNILNNCDSNIATYALSLFITILKFLMRSPPSILGSSNKTDYLLSENIDIPKNMLVFYENTTIPQNLFRIYNEYKLKDAIDALSYYSCASNISWKQIGVSHITFINYMAANLTQILESNITDENCFLSLTQLLYRLGIILPPVTFSKDSNLSTSFFASVQKVTLLAFQSFLTQSFPCSYLLKFWANIASNIELRNNVPSSLLQIFPVIFDSCVTAIIDSVTSGFSILDFTQNFPDFNQFIEEIKPIWCLASHCIPQTTEIIISLFNQFLNQVITTPNHPETPFYILKLSLLILILTSRFSGRFQTYYITPIVMAQITSISGAVFNLIGQTNPPVLNGLVNLYSPFMTMLEKSLKCFAMNFKKNFFCTTNPEIDQLFQNIQLSKQAAYDLLINRFLTDMSLFIAFPELLLEILMFVDDLIGTLELKQFNSSNQLLQSLISRQIFLEFDKIDDLEKMFRLLSDLNKLCAKSITSNFQMNNFLSFFDQQFNTAASNSNFSDPKQVFIIFREIIGVMKGTSSIILYLIVFRWLLKNHIDHILQCLQIHSNQPIIVRSIARVWCSLVVDKSRKLILPGYSSEGIVLIKHTLNFLGVMMSSVPDSDMKLMYMVKILSASISAPYVNYGIMKLYNDTTLDQLIHLFFTILGGWPFESYSQFNNMIILISNAISSIFDISPETIENTTYFPIICKFYLQSIIEFPKIYIGRYINAHDRWPKFCESFTKLLVYFLNRQNSEVWPNFRPHFLAFLDLLMNCEESVTNGIVAPLFICAKSDSAYVTQVFQLICNSFDENFHESLANLLQTTFAPVNGDWNDNTAKKFRSTLDKFKKSIKRFSIHLSSIPEFVPVFALNQ